MTIEGVIHDMKLDLVNHQKVRGNALRRGEDLMVSNLDGRIEEIKHWLKLVEKIEKPLS